MLNAFFSNLVAFAVVFVLSNAKKKKLHPGLCWDHMDESPILIHCLVFRLSIKRCSVTCFGVTCSIPTVNGDKASFDFNYCISHQADQTQRVWWVSDHDTAIHLTAFYLWMSFP